MHTPSGLGVLNYVAMLCGATLIVETGGINFNMYHTQWQIIMRIKEISFQDASNRFQAYFTYRRFDNSHESPTAPCFTDQPSLVPGSSKVECGTQRSNNGNWHYKPACPIRPSILLC